MAGLSGYWNLVQFLSAELFSPKGQITGSVALRETS